MIQRPNYSAPDTETFNESGIINECIDAVRRMQFLQSALAATKEIRAVAIQGFNAIVEGTELAGVVGGIVEETQQGIPDLIQMITWAEERLRTRILQLSGSARKQVVEVLGDIANTVLGDVEID